jgi:DNA-binding NtrC family response regulator
MQVLFIFYEDSLKQLFHMIVESEGHTVISTQSAAEAIRLLEENPNEPFLLFADNTVFNEEAMCVFAMLRTSPGVRCRVRIIGWNAMRDRDYLQERADGMLDDFLSMPFTGDQLLSCIAGNAANLTE